MTRKPGEFIDISDPETGEVFISIAVVRVNGNQVRIGVEAPREFPVHRREVMDEIRREERDSTAGRNLAIRVAGAGALSSEEHR